MTKGVNATKKLVTGNSEEVETLHMRPEGSPYEPSNDYIQPHTDSSSDDLRTGSGPHETNNKGNQDQKKGGDYSDVFSDKDLKEF